MNTLQQLQEGGIKISIALVKVVYPALQKYDDVIWQITLSADILQIIWGMIVALKHQQLCTMQRLYEVYLGA